MEPAEVGGKYLQNKVIVGKVYAKWCGHCKNLKPEWKRMKKHINQKKGKKHIVYAEIEENEIGTKLRNVEIQNNVKVQIDGYPTLFRIVGGKLEYYNGNRQSEQMADWYLNGGKEDLEKQSSDLSMYIPKLLKDVQGGSKYFTRRRNRHNYRRSRHHIYSNSTKKNRTRGILDFLFGKRR